MTSTQLDRFARNPRTSAHRRAAKRAFTRALRRDWKSMVSTGNIDAMDVSSFGFHGFVS